MSRDVQPFFGRIRRCFLSSRLACAIFAGWLGAGAGCSGETGVGSVGAVFTRDSEARTLMVREAPAGAAAGRAGLLAGDQVLMIDGQYVKDMTSKEVRTKLRGEVGSTVRLTVVRGEDEVHHVQVRRAEVGERKAPTPREERITE